MTKKLSEAEILHVAELAKLQIKKADVSKYTDQLNSVIEFVSKIQKLDTTSVIETSQVTGLENVLREDVVDEKTMLTQDEALSNTKRKLNGYFVVDAVFGEE